MDCKIKEEGNEIGTIKWYKQIVPIAIYADKTVLGYKNGWLCKMSVSGEITKICPFFRTFVDRVKESSRLTSRMFRTDVKTSCILPCGDVYFFKNKTLYRYVDKTLKLEKVTSLQQGASTPLNITPALENSEYRVFWGDYFGNSDRKEVGIWGVDNNGTSALVYRFPAGSVRHIHNIVRDNERKGYFILTGDNDPQAGIYYSDACFSKVEPIFIGVQQARAVQGFVVDGTFLYATDSVSEQNFICKLEKDGEWIHKVVVPINGSCIYATRRGSTNYFSTTVESPEVDGHNKLMAMLSTKRGSGILSNDVEIVSVDKDFECKIIATFKKDALPYKLFQYGAITFPSALCANLVLYPVGVKKYDGVLGVLDL